MVRYKQMYKVVLKRFAKGFIAGGIATTIALLNSGVTIKSLEDLKALLVSLLIGFITGGLMAIEKAFTYRP